MFLFLFISLVFSHELTVNFEKHLSQEGQLLIAVHKSSQTFLKEDQLPFKYKVLKIKGLKNLKFELPSGTYAITAFHDLNMNKKLDKNFLGMPKEPFAFSNNPLIIFGPPSFKKASFNVVENSEIKIDWKDF